MWVQGTLEGLDWQLELRPDTWNCALCGQSIGKSPVTPNWNWHPKRVCKVRIRGEDGPGWGSLQESQCLEGS